jgi:hypothetical protein
LATAFRNSSGVTSLLEIPMRFETGDIRETR